MINTTKRFDRFTAAGFVIFFLLAFLNPLAAVQDLEKSETLQLKKVPVSMQLPPALAKSSILPGRQVVAPQGGLVTILSENFEGTFPSGSWSVNTGDYTWAKRNCSAHAGSYSAWAVGGGTSGSALSCGANYPNSISTIMVYGPFDLSDANWAAFNFWVSLNSEESNDYFSFMASEDGSNFSGYALSGTTDGTWIPYTQALTAVPTESGDYQNLTGKPSVWIAFAFSSDGTTSYANGVFVDDVVLQKGTVKVPTIVTSFASPGPSPRGLAFDGANLWCSDATNDRIYKLTTTGGVVSSFASPSTVSTGLTWDGTNLWNSDANTDRIYKLSTTGAVLTSFAAPGTSGAGLCWDGNGLWHSDANVATIWKLNTTGGILNSFSASGTFHYGLAYDGQNLYLADAEALLIYKMNTAGTALDYYLVPGTFPTGLTWDGSNLWAADIDTDVIYKLQVEIQQLVKDVGVTAIEVPNTVAKDSPVQIVVTLKNFGTAAQSNFPASYQINADAPVTENYSGTLQPGASQSFTFATPWTPNTSGTYTIAARTALVGDEKSENDKITKTVQVTAAHTYCSSEVPKNISSLDSVASTVTITSDLIVGDLNVKLFIEHTNDSDLDVFLTSPGGTRIELFTDVGGSDNNFGSTCSPLPDCILDDQAATSIAIGSAPFVGSFQSEGLALGRFNGENARGTWTLTIIDDASSYSGTLDCWCLEIEPAPPKDVGVTAIDLPKLVLLGNSVSIGVRVKNFGSAAQSNFPMSYSINSGPALTENFTGTLEAGTGTTKTFAGQWTPGAEGIYRFVAWTALSGDANSSNDTLPTPKGVTVRKSNAIPVLAGINNYTMRAGATRYVRFSAIDAEGDSMTFSIPTNPGFLSLSGFSQKGDTATATLVISPPRKLTGSFSASLEVRDRFDATASITFTVQVVPRVLNPPTNLTASLSQNVVQLNWEAPVIASNSPYAGVWSGSNSQNLPVYMSVTDDGFIDSLNVRFRTYWINYTCTLNFPRNDLVELKDAKFDAYLSGYPITSVSTTLHGTFSSESAVSGKYDEYSGGGYIYCGSTFIIQFGGTQLSAGTWQASKIAPGGGTQPPVLLGYDIYRSSQPNARLTGTKIGSTDANITTFTDPNLGDGTYFYQVTARHDLGESDPGNEVSILITGVQDRLAELPAEYALEQNYPNPFNPETEIRFQLPKAGHVVLKIFNTLGAEIRTLVDAPYQAGYHRVRWDSKNNHGNRVASGVYFYQLRAGDFSQVKKMSLLR